jgi:hypothetical protein
MGNSKSKGKKAGKKAIKGLKKLERKDFKITKLPQIDDFFSKIQPPMDTLCTLSDAVAAVNDGINFLMESEEFIASNVEKTTKGVFQFTRSEAKKAGTDFVLIVVETGYVTLEPRGEPQGFVAKAWAEIKKLVDAIKDVIEQAPGLKDQIQDAATASKDLPNKVKSDAATAGLNPLDTAKAAKAVGDNCKYLGGFPNDVISFIENVKDLVKTLQEVFGSSGEEQQTQQSEGQQTEGEQKAE